MLSYLDVHLLFLSVPAFAFARHAHVNTSGKAVGTDARRHGWLAIAIMAVVATVWTTPWDNLMVLYRVWFYDDARVLATLGAIPIEEQLFFIVQPLFTGFAYLAIYSNSDLLRLRRRRRWPRVVFPLAALAGSFVGALQLAEPGWFYLGSFLLWFSLPLALQWRYGADLVLDAGRSLLLVGAVATSYLCLMDALAIRDGVWSISTEHTVGLSVLGLPVEEVVFFAGTNALVLQGLFLTLHFLHTRSSRRGRPTA